jgi:hypothetical protein
MSADVFATEKVLHQSGFPSAWLSGWLAWVHTEPGCEQAIRIADYLSGRYDLIGEIWCTGLSGGRSGEADGMNVD